MHILSLAQIKKLLDVNTCFQLIEQAFVEFSKGKAILPPVGELLFDNPPGDAHIKYGYLKGGEHFVVKIASGFYQNPDLNLPVTHGVMLLFSQKTGFLQAILLDEGTLTDIRTAIAGAVAAKYLAPKRVTSIGMIGAGTQACYQLEYLKFVVNCQKVMVWNRSQEKLQHFINKAHALGFEVTVADSIQWLASQSNLIITTTPAEKPLLHYAQIQPGTHITAVGADSPHKQEIATDIIQQADWVIADSIAQCQTRGEIAHAVKSNLIDLNRVLELGTCIANPRQLQRSDTTISIADLTGLAISDLAISEAVFKSSLNSKQEA